MADFTSQRFNLSQINDGKRYENGDSIEADAINFPIEAAYYAQELAKAVANEFSRLTGTEVTAGLPLAVNALVVGDGEAADLSIAGGTTNIADYGQKAGLTLTEIATLTALLIANGGINKSVASAPLSIALGLSNKSTKSGAITLGYGNENNGFNSTAIGALNRIYADSSLSYGYKNYIYGNFGTTIGQENVVGVEGSKDTITNGFAGGILSQATGKGAFAFGNECKAQGDYSIAMGGDCKTTTSAIRGCAFGDNTTVTGKYGFAANSWTEAGKFAFACGDSTHATGDNSFTAGWKTYATKESAFAEGTDTQAKHGNSHAGGIGTRTGRDNQTVVGQYNKVSSKALFVVGDGSNDKNRTNIFEANDDGTAYLNGKPIATEEYVNNAIAQIKRMLNLE